MPKCPINYDNIVYYKIYCKDKNVKDLYIGYTTSYTKRKSQHKRECTMDSNKKYNDPLYRHIRNNGGWDNWNMSVYKAKKLKNRLDADVKLDFYKSKLGATF